MSSSAFEPRLPHEVPNDPQTNGADAVGRLHLPSSAESVAIAFPPPPPPPALAATKVGSDVSSAGENLHALRGCSYLLYSLPVLAGFVNPIMRAQVVRLEPILGSSYWAVLLGYAGAILLSVGYALCTERLPSYHVVWIDLRSFISQRMHNCLILLGGVAGAMQHIVSAEVESVIDKAMVAAGLMAGEQAISMIFDGTGILWTRGGRLNWITAAGAILSAATFGTFLVIAFRTWEDINAKHVVFFMFAILSGLIAGFQAALGRKLGSVLGHFRRALAWNYLSGSVFSLILALSTVPKPRFHRLTPYDWWALCLGPLSIVYLTIVTLLPPTLGFCQTFALVCVGQLLGTLILDHEGTLRRILSYAVGVPVCAAAAILIHCGRAHQPKKRNP